MFSGQSRETLAGYSLAVGLVSVALLLTHLAWPLLEQTPFFLLFAATMISARWAGERPGLLSIPLAAVGQLVLIGDEFPPQFAYRSVGVFIALALAVNRLIVSRDRIEAALRASEERFRAAWEHAGIGAALLDRGGSILAINPALQRILGYRPEDCIGRQFLEFTHQVEAGEERELFIEVADGRRDQYRREQRYRKHDGTVMWGHVVTSVIRADDGRPAGALLMLEDITGRKALEQQVRQIQKLDAMGRLVAGVAHDFNNFLTAIGGYTELVLRELRDDSPGRRDLEEVLTVSRRAAALTRQLLIFSRQPALESDPIYVDRVVAPLESLLRQLLGENIRIVTALNAPAARVKVDPSHLEQIVVNLAVNARDAMPQGGTLTIETSGVELDDTYSDGKPAHPPAGSYLLLIVSDTGHGMDAATKDRIFEPFFTTKTAGKGTGLGLSTVYGIVKQIGGYIWVYSDPGHGTSFKIYFPRVIDTPESAPSVVVRPQLPQQQKTILVVEDDPSVRALTCTILRKEGYEVLDAESGEQALRLAAEHAGSIDLIIADLSLPVMGGIELVRHLRSQERNLRVLHVSGFSELMLGTQAVLDAESGFLPKPFTRDQLISRVRELIDRPSRSPTLKG